MTGVMYLRKSRADDPGESAGETLRRHEETLRALARETGVPILRVYREVVSGDHLSGREEMRRLLADCVEGGFDAVLCMDIDRLGRGSMAEQGYILDTLKTAGVRIITPRKVYNLNDDLDETYSEFESFIARQELKMIKRRLRRGIRHSAEMGSYVSAPPYGYRRAAIGGQPSLEPIPEEAEAVRQIFTWYTAEGLGCQQIADRLNGMGYLPRRAARFGRTAVLDILSNPVYIGRVVRGGTDGVDVPGLHPSLIAEETFRTAAAIRQRRSHPPAAARTLCNPLAGLIRCARCGEKLRRLSGNGAGREPRLVCPTKGCSPGIPLAAAEEALVHALLPLLPSVLLPPETDLPASAPAARRKALDDQRQRLYTLLEQGVYSPEEFRQRREQLDRQTAAVAAEDTRTPGTVPTPTTAAEALAAASPVSRHRLYVALIERIVYRCDGERRELEVWTRV